MGSQDSSWNSLVYKLVNNPYGKIALPLAICGAFKLYIDPDKFVPYYYCESDGSCYWDAPSCWNDDLAVVPPLSILVGGQPPRKWCVYKDPQYWVQFFVNAATGETQWHPPAEILSQVIVGVGAELAFATPCGRGAAPHGVSLGQSPPQTDAPGNSRNSQRRSSLGDAPTMLIKARIAAFQADCTSMRQDGCGLALVRNWMILLDEKTGALYYAHAVSGSVQWEVPSDVLAAELTDWEAIPERTSSSEEQDVDNTIRHVGGVDGPPAVLVGDRQPPTNRLLTESSLEAGNEAEVVELNATPRLPTSECDASPPASDAYRAVLDSTPHPTGPITVHGLLSHMFRQNSEKGIPSLPAWVSAGAPPAPAEAPGQVKDVTAFGGAEANDNAKDVALEDNPVESSAPEALAIFAEAAGLNVEQASSAAATMPGGQVAFAKELVNELAARIKALEAQAAAIVFDVPGQAIMSSAARAAAEAMRASIMAELILKKAQVGKLRSWLLDQKRRDAAAVRNSNAAAMAAVLAEQAAHLEARRREIALQRARSGQVAGKTKEGVLAARRASVAASKEAQQELEARSKKEIEEGVAAKARLAAGRRASLTGASMPGPGTRRGSLIGSAGMIKLA